LLKFSRSFIFATNRYTRPVILSVGLLLLLSSCLRLSRIPPTESGDVTQTPNQNNLTAVPTPSLTQTPFPYPWTDENAMMSGVCFEYALERAEEVFTLRDAEAHMRFYDEADDSRLCRRPVTRNPFDFDDGRVLVGLWSAGQGCVARHDVLAIERDDEARILRIDLRFVTEGDCPYELVRPFWIGLEDVSDYQIEIVVK
jgi:hypothetical protein